MHLSQSRTMPEWLPLSAEALSKRATVMKEDSPDLDVVVSTPGSVVMPSRFPAEAGRIFDFKVRPSDVWLVSYPKTGTTMTQVTQAMPTSMFNPVHVTFVCRNCCGS